MRAGQDPWGVQKPLVIGRVVRLPWKEPGFEFYAWFLACSMTQGSLFVCQSAVLGRALASSPDSDVN